ncbi:hypothetical protein FHX64_000104 [Microbacter margulisiae]|uniref:Uncharacterized protein n=1 Tax=Microbacter margulisiae TaxID=1350067 RepID=A0A7W5DND0_9PORP|nr:hypothetical protein [Microbacter margulisiae]
MPIIIAVKQLLIRILAQKALEKIFKKIREQAIFYVPAFYFEKPFSSFSSYHQIVSAID